MPIAPDDIGQRRHQVRFDWAEHGLRALAGFSSVVVVVDVLSFGTAVDVATGRGARVLPLPWRDERARRAADDAGAVLASRRSRSEWSLSPSSLRTLPRDTLLALASPNGATLSARAARSGATVFAGCLRNAAAVANAAREAAGNDGAVAVIAAGERHEDGALRPAVEDLLGAGAVIDALGAGSPEADVAASAFRASSARLRSVLTECASGRELAALGYGHDVDLAADSGSSPHAPVLVDGTFGPHGCGTADPAAPGGTPS